MLHPYKSIPGPVLNYLAALSKGIPFRSSTLALAGLYGW